MAIQVAAALSPLCDPVDRSPPPQALILDGHAGADRRSRSSTDIRGSRRIPSPYGTGEETPSRVLKSRRSDDQRGLAHVLVIEPFGLTRTGWRGSIGRSVGNVAGRTRAAAASAVRPVARSHGRCHPRPGERAGDIPFGNSKRGGRMMNPRGRFEHPNEKEKTGEAAEATFGGRSQSDAPRPSRERARVSFSVGGRKSLV